MSYCRWSSDCHQSDVYVYESDSGWITHVAGRVRRPLKPVPVPPETSSVESTMAYWMACDRWVSDKSNWEWHPVDARFAGMSFTDDTAKDCTERLRELKAAGLNVPQYAIDDLEAEVAE